MRPTQASTGWRRVGEWQPGPRDNRTMNATPTQSPVLIAGGGIGGMALALTLHQIGVPCVVLEAVPELAPLGVGINLQPNAVRELFDLGLGAGVLDTIGLPAREWALVGRNGNDVYAEPRGLLAGYRWPQYAVHRGQLQMLMYRTVLQRLGPDAVRLGQRVTGYRQTAGGVVAQVETRSGQRPTACTRRCARRCTPRSRPSSGAAPSCGAAPARAGPSAAARRSWAWAR
jgi:2-polyprenyl-6-methoxyphenol hydroxylase-like FAD-dependent oxidoreductase